MNPAAGTGETQGVEAPAKLVSAAGFNAEIMTAAERKRYKYIKDSLHWYQRGHSLLAPLRYHLNELVEALDSINMGNDALREPRQYVRQIEAARKQNEKVNDFFSPKPKK